MRKLIVCILAAAELSLAQPTSAKPAAAPAIRLTATDEQSGPGCTLYLDRRKRVAVGWMMTYEDNEAWHIGINGSVYMFPIHTYADHTVSLFNRNRTIRVIIRDSRILTRSNGLDSPEFGSVSLDITIGGTSRTLNAFKWCVEEH